jgi:hypothetical protein
MILKSFQQAGDAPPTYLVGDSTSGAAVLIDPGNDVQAYLRKAEQLKLEVGHVFANDFGKRIPLGLLRLRDMDGVHLHVSARSWTPDDVSSLLPGSTVTVGAFRIHLLLDDSGAESIAVIDLRSGEPILVASSGRLAA